MRQQYRPFPRFNFLITWERQISTIMYYAGLTKFCAQVPKVFACEMLPECHIWQIILNFSQNVANKTCQCVECG